MKIANNKPYSHLHETKIFFKLALLLLCCWGSNGTGTAQTNGLRFEKIGFEQGLSGENVVAILQDRKGYMWFGTLDGLNKYDGYSFTKYQFDPHDTNSISQNLIYTIFEDSEGTIWVSTFEGLCRFDRHTEKFTRYKPSKNAEYADPNITVISEDADGMIWVGSASGGLCRFDKKKGMFLPEYFDLGYGHLKDDKAKFRDAINCIYKDKAGTLWIGNTTGLHKLNLTKKKAGQLSQVHFTRYQNNPVDVNSLSSNLVSSVFEDRTGILWVATDNGLNSFDKKTGVFKRFQHNPKNKHSISSHNFSFWIGNRIKEDKEGNLWIGTNKGLNKLNKERTIFTAYLHKPDDVNSISSDVIFSLEIDQAGILWAGGWDSKLNKADLNLKPFNVVRHDPNNVNSLSNNLVTSILEDAAGMTWIGTFQGGLNSWDRKSNQFKRYRHDATNSHSLRSDSVNAILEDRHGCFWVCNGNVLSKLNKTTGTFKHYPVNVSAGKIDIQQMIYCIEEDLEGLLWLGSENGLYSFNEKTGKFKAYHYNPRDTANGISDYTSIAIFADSRDNIWIGHGSIATDRFDKKTGRFTHYKYDPTNPTGISSNIVHDFFEDAKGNIWFGTSAGGLSYLNKETGNFTTYTKKHGLASNTVHSILEDDRKQIWLGTRNGISKFDPVSKTFTHYDYNDGLQGKLFAAGDRERAAHFKGKDGTLYFGGIDGIVFFDPSKIKADRHVAPLVITQFKLFDRVVKGAHELKEIVLNYDENYFSFEFSSLSFHNPAKNQYAYKLEGIDRDWVYSGSRRYVGYTNIDPGEYTFSVKGTNHDGIWNEKGTFITVIVKPPWWRTWWAYTLFALAVAGLLYAFLRYRITKIHMQHEVVLQKHKASELEMQALRSQMNPHFIFNSLNSINHFILQNNKLQASEYLTKFSKLIRLILQNSQESYISLESELESLRLYLELEAVRFDHHFEFRINVDNELDTKIIKIPPLIIQPYAENAIWHGLMNKEDKGHLQIDLFRNADLLYCRITDDGVGRKKAAEFRRTSGLTYKSMGLQITASRIEMLQRKSQAEEAINIIDLVLADGSAGGTQVLLKIPICHD